MKICRDKAVAGDRACPPIPPLNFHGKEGVDGSSPSEGFRKGQQMAFFVALIRDTRPLGAPATCPQNLSPTLREASKRGLNRRFARHRAPPWNGGARLPEQSPQPPRPFVGDPCLPDRVRTMIRGAAAAQRRKALDSAARLIELGYARRGGPGDHLRVILEGRVVNQALRSAARRAPPA